MTQRLIVLGAGGNSIAIADAVRATNRAEPGRYELTGCLDDTPELQGREVGGMRVLGSLATAHDHHDCFFVNGIASLGSFRKKPELIARTGIAAERFASIVHPAAVIADSARIGRGCVVLANSFVGCDAQLGDHVLILQNTTINHHTRVGDYCTFSAGITVLGEIEIGRCAFVGGGASIAPYVKIGDEAIVGLGAVVIRDVPPRHVVAGSPARTLRVLDATP